MSQTKPRQVAFTGVLPTKNYPNRVGVKPSPRQAGSLPRPLERCWICPCGVGELSTHPTDAWVAEVRARHSGKGHALVEATPEIVAPSWGFGQRGR